MSGIKRLSKPPVIEPDDDGIAVSFTSGDKTNHYWMSWHHFTLALHDAGKLFAAREARENVVRFKAGG